MLPLLVAVGVLLIARQAQTWVDALVLGVGLVAALVAFERWTAGDVLRVALPCLVVSAAVWPYGVLAVDGDVQGAYYALAIVACLVVPELPRRRAQAAVAVGAYVAAVGTWGLLADGAPTAGGLVSLVIIPTGFTVALIGLRFPNKGFYDVVRELEEAREREAELAVVRERMRFASDLHDIQGHTLHVVKLKIALAQRLVTRDPARAEQELRETYDLVGETISQARELAYGQRRLNLSAELENARHLFEAAGIHVRVDRPPDLGERADDLLGQVLRETTTNVLRHSRATLVHVSVTEDGLTVVNDGVADDGPPTLRGLAALARRVSDDGGELTAEVADGRFRTSVTLPARGRTGGPSRAGTGGGAG
ncbi:sensor histidine kinase [Cellulosimicrobium cellulans]|uniref:sensor histidine kinase n=1 Tax=Cellulosimicrobium cellulans TaxID=1710 RepID=UPI001EDA614A|nr:histidine kinase [Cellulosimicrobium cellulans]UKJ65830.1 sensor histidine kinase [Cellulosimicrobium cellulans]